MARILAVVRSDGPSLAQRENFMGRTTLSGEVTETSQTFIPIGAGVLSNHALHRSVGFEGWWRRCPPFSPSTGQGGKATLQTGVKL